MVEYLRYGNSFGFEGNRYGSVGKWESERDTGNIVDLKRKAERQVDNTVSKDELNVLGVY